MNRTILIVLVALIFINSILAGRVPKGDAKPTRNAKDKRIVGGEAAMRHSFPHHVALLKPEWDKERYPNGQMPYCSGSIIGKQFIITAAHCITGDFRRTTILAGGHNHSKYEGTEQIIKVKSYLKHAHYTDEGVSHDVALVMLEKPFKYNQYVKKIKLSKAKNYPTGKVKISGWGLTKGSNQDSIPDVLQTATLDIQSYEKCAELWTGFYPSRAFCAKIPGKKVDFCNGDSGGSGIQNIKGENVQIGVVNFSANRCAKQNQPGTFLWVARYSDWIKKAKEALKNGKTEVHDSTEYTEEVIVSDEDEGSYEEEDEDGNFEESDEE